MNTATARARLKAMTAADSAPTLSADEIASLLSLAAVADAAGNAPSSADWTPTYDLNRAAAEGWRWKAAQLVGKFDFSADGATFNRGQMIEQCEKMIAQYSKKVVSYAGIAAPVAAADADDEEEE